MVHLVVDARSPGRRVQPGGGRRVPEFLGRQPRTPVFTSLAEQRGDPRRPADAGPGDHRDRLPAQYRPAAGILTRAIGGLRASRAGRLWMGGGARAVAQGLGPRGTWAFARGG